MALFKKKKKHNDAVDAIASLVNNYNIYDRLIFDQKGRFVGMGVSKKKFNIGDYPGKCVMHCETDEELLKFYDYLHSVGRKWSRGNSYKEFRPTKTVDGRATRYIYFNNGLHGATCDDSYIILNFKDFDWSDFNMKETKFKVGDVVRVVASRTESKNKFIGKIFTITRYSIGGCEKYDSYHVDGVDGYVFFNDEIEFVKDFTKADLKPGMVVELRGGGRYLFVNDKFANVHEWTDSKHYNNDLTHPDYEELSIVKVYTSTGYTLGNMLSKPSLNLIWERKDDIKEMTVAEIEEKLGYKVKVIADKE